MFNGRYFNLLKEGRINDLFKACMNYSDLTKKGFELPLINTSIKYILPLFLGNNITQLKVHSI